jgi:acetoin utilization deacetylase AcuC-like enzyme
MRLTEQGFGELTSLVLDMAREHCGGRAVSVLEGGYHPAALTACVTTHLKALMGAE